MAETRTAEEIAQAYKQCLDGATAINSVISAHNKGDDVTPFEFGYDMTHDQKKAQVASSVFHLKHQKTLTDWTDEDFTVIDKAITDADAFTG